MSGELLELPVFSVDTPLLELKALIKEHWHIPVAAQCLTSGLRFIEDADSVPLGRVLARAGVQEPEEADGVVELSCVRRAIPEDVQSKLDYNLLVATSLGDHAGMAEALSEGALTDMIVSQTDQVSQKTPTPLMIAITARDQQACELLRAAGAMECDLRPRLHSLGRALESKDLAEAVKILAFGANPNVILRHGEGIRDTSKGTALHALCAMHKLRGSRPVVELLCRLGADLDAPDGEGDSPLAHARYWGADEIYGALEARGAKITGMYYSTLLNAGRRIFGVR